MLCLCVQLVAATGVNNSSASDEISTAGTSVEKGAPAQLGEVSGADSLQGECSSAEWKYATLVRLRKFLRRQYRARKNKVVDSVSISGDPGTDIADERAQLQQLAEDIKSIEFEIRMLSGNKTLLQNEATDCKDESLQGDSARSQRDTVRRVLRSAGSHKSGSASRKAESRERLAELHEGDEGDTAGEEEAGDELRGVRRNLLDLYAEPIENQDEGKVDSRLSVGAGGTLSLVPADSGGENLQSVDECIQAIRLVGERARNSVDARGERENNTSPSKIARLARQMPTGDQAEREDNSSPSKIDRMRRNSSPSKIDRMLRQKVCITLRVYVSVCACCACLSILCTACCRGAISCSKHPPSCPSLLLTLVLPPRRPTTSRAIRTNRLGVIRGAMLILPGGLRSIEAPCAPHRSLFCFRALLPALHAPWLQATRSVRSAYRSKRQRLLVLVRGDVCIVKWMVLR